MRGTVGGIGWPLGDDSMVYLLFGIIGMLKWERKKIQDHIFQWKALFPVNINVIRDNNEAVASSLYSPCDKSWKIDIPLKPRNVFLNVV